MTNRPITGITEAFKADSFEKKINLGKAALHYLFTLRSMYMAFRLNRTLPQFRCRCLPR